MKAAAEKEFHLFTEILHQHNVPYCMDSGVLLALMREGKIFDHEKDIDLQMWSDDEQKFIAIIPELKAKGWKVTIWQYKGLVYQFRIQRPGQIPVHIMLFRRQGEWAWCPAGRATGNPFSGFMKKGYSMFVRVRRNFRDKLKATDVSRWPWNVRRDLGTWWVPSEFFENTIFNKEHQVYIPARWEQYLAFRYGNWKTPAANWDFWKDDGAMNHKRPDELVEIL
jgi:hypothetical protein